MSSAYLNAHFISIKINGQEGEGKKYKTKFNVRGYPTVIFFQNNGAEIDRICGYDGDKTSFYQTVVDYVNGKNTLGDLQARLSQSLLNVQANYLLAKKYIARWESDEAQPYFRKILELDAQDVNGYGEECRGFIAVHTLRTTDDDQPLIVFLEQATNKTNLEQGYNVLIRFYRQKEMPDKLLSTYEQVIKRLPDNADFMNDYAWYLYSQKLKDHYERGIQLAQQALRIRPEAANIWDTLAWLEFENGLPDQAIEHMKKAVQLAPQKTGYLENLKKMERARKL
jgi:tetratricopeptide (TPR) repeat protein